MGDMPESTAESETYEPEAARESAAAGKKLRRGTAGKPAAALTNAERQRRHYIAVEKAKAEAAGYQRGIAEAESRAAARMTEFMAANRPEALQGVIDGLRAQLSQFSERQIEYRNRVDRILAARNEQIEQLRRQLTEERNLAQLAVRPAPAPAPREERAPVRCPSCGHLVRVP
jgi:hypothetical protein